MSQLPRIQSPKSVQQPARESASFPDLYASRVLINPKRNEDGKPYIAAVEMMPYDYENDQFPEGVQPWDFQIDDLKRLAAIEAAEGDDTGQQALGAVINWLKSIANRSDVAAAMQQGRRVEIKTETGEITAEGSG